ncbi:hypothetical protein ACHAXT_007893 [Thalassiosira profunda]
MTPHPSASSARGGGGADPATAQQKLTHHISLLLAVVASRRWHSFDRIALANPGVFRMISDALPRHPDADGDSLLHACLRHDPPAATVVRILKLVADREAALRCPDGDGRTPLHVAVACRADPAVVKLLASVDSSTCAMGDDDGRTPLHLACDPSDDAPQDGAEGSPADEKSSRQHPTVRALLSESLEPTQIEDEDGSSPLELAILSDAPIAVVKLLQKATMECLRRKTGDDASATKRRKMPEAERPSVEAAGAAFAGSQRRSVARKVSLELGSVPAPKKVSVLAPMKTYSIINGRAPIFALAKANNGMDVVPIR